MSFLPELNNECTLKTILVSFPCRVLLGFDVIDVCLNMLMFIIEHLWFRCDLSSLPYWCIIAPNVS